MRDAVIVEAVRTPIGKGKPGGALAGVHPVELLAHTLGALVERSGVNPALVDDVIGGCVDQVGEQAMNLTRYAWLSAGFPDTVPATTVDRQCGSSQQAVHFAAQGGGLGAYDLVV
ncbi:steroid 3-ketoacyl-CoA thiolase, partial [Streptomyces sp. MCAF7]